MDEPGTVFCLVPQNDHAEEIVEDDANRERRRADPDDVSKRFLRIGFDQPAKIPGRLATFGRMPFTNDVILRGKSWSKSDQCYFNFHPITGELLLHDISKRGNTRLHDEREGIPDQIWKSPRQCVVLLTRLWTFEMGCAKFQLIPREVPSDQDKAAFAEEKLAFVRQPVPDEYEGTYEGTLERLLAFDLQSRASTTTINSHNTRVTHPDRLKQNEEIRYTQLEKLGDGGQGDVYEVIDMYDGEHYACKIVAFKAIPQWGIHTEKDFKERAKREVDLVKKATHPHIVPYLFHQGWEHKRHIEIFMPVYKGSLQKLMRRIRPQGQEAVQAWTGRMLYQILLALHHVHTNKPPIIHRDIKPPNILYHGDKFLLADFGIAKLVDTSRTFAGTDAYIAPEVRMSGDQTPKVDIYSLGATVIECFQEFPSQVERLARWPQWQQWHEHLQTRAEQLEPLIAPMLRPMANERPTAHELLDDLFPQVSQASIRTPENDLMPPNFEMPVPITNQASRTTMIYSAAPTPMDWTRVVSTGLFQRNAQPTPQNESTQVLQPNPGPIQPPKMPPNRPRQEEIRRKRTVRPANGRQNGRGHHVPPRNERHAMSQSAGIPKRASSGRSRRSRSKSLLKTQKTRDTGMH